MGYFRLMNQQDFGRIEHLQTLEWRLTVQQGVFMQAFVLTSGLQHSRKLTWKPKKSPLKTTVLLQGDYMGFHVSLGECRPLAVFWT